MSKKQTPSETSGAAGETFVVERVEQLKALAHPLRQRILERLAEKPRTTKQVAVALGEKPTRLYHHVATLERAGLVHLVETRPNRGTTEKYYAAVSQRIEIDPEALSATGAAAVNTGIVDGLVGTLRSELVELMNRGAMGGAEAADALREEGVIAQLEVRGTAEEMAQIRQEIEGLLKRVTTELRQNAEAGGAVRGAKPVPAGDPDSDPIEGPDENRDEEPKRHRLMIAWYPLGPASDEE